MKAKRTTGKYWGNEEFVSVEDPLFYDDEGDFKKRRRNFKSNLIPKKKKRK